ncbi:tyrosine-protein phosphatase [Bradyrhizobium sp. SSUT18]|uniref:tyrosine-protein phosphatase n=1 Tax=unclassified Bradyrhizobium TaxID=2631580 RepID=UPI002447D827|nr:MULTISPECIES: tyrosine-protein phosphatase [unclassified Bradyrhizobium]MDH2354584.1 tyrosine-protein phosphatase [Bradyrhizobium sp. SSUT112]MDH2403029.1 tyrosine-protein phosphatase [Bradyrhizobium sp. SSUT18]
MQDSSVQDSSVQDSSVQDSPARHLALQGASNFRDLGGYPTADGRTTRWRHIFRSNHLGQLTAADVEIVRALGVRSAFDFRGVEERAAGVCVVNEIAVYSLPIEPTVVAALRAELARGRLTAPVALELMRESYRNYVRHNTASFRNLFGHLLEDRAPLVIHCTAGKDRTGFASALILHALGVADDVIAADYLLTNRHYRRDASNASDLPADVLDAIGSVEASYLAAAFEAVDSAYGDLDTYLRDGLKLGTPERTALKARYLQS